MKNKQSKIIKAIISRQSNGLLKLLKEEPSIVNEKIDLVTTHTPLSFAIISGNYSAVLSLIVAGANVNGDKELNKIPLHIACSMGKSNLVDLLLDNGVNPNELDKLDNNALFYLLDYIRLDDAESLSKNNANIVSIVNKLVKSGIDKNQKNKKGISILDIINKAYMKSSSLKSHGLKIKNALDANGCAIPVNNKI